jgi:hypothetical protein
MLPEGAVLTGQLVMSIGRFCSKLGVIQNIVKVFNAGEAGGAAAAGEAAEEAEQAASEAEEDLGAVGEGGTAAEDAVEAVSIMSKVSTFLKVLGGIGLVVTLIVGIVELVEGAEQKTKLIDAIQGCQPGRLCIKYYKAQADNILQQLETLVVYLQASSGPDADPDVAKYLATSIGNAISAADAAIDWTQMEQDLEAQDRSSGNYYGDDDLPTDQVVKIAQGLATPPPPISGASPQVALKAPAAAKPVAAKPVAVAAHPPAAHRPVVPPHPAVHHPTPLHEPVHFTR